MKKVLTIMTMVLALGACGQKSHGPAIDLSDLDTTVSPKVDFYRYATGGWKAKNPLRPEFSRFGSFDPSPRVPRRTSTPSSPRWPR